MARPANGSIEVVVLGDGTRAFHLRFRAAGQRQREIVHERPGCMCGCGGGWDERGARTELGNLLARVRAGVWERRVPMPAPPAQPEAPAVPTFHEYASAWLRAKVDGVLGDKPIDANTQADYRWRLSNHLLPYFAGYRLDQIDRQLCQAFKAQKLREASELRAAIAAGADLRDRFGRRRRPLSASSIRKLIDTLAAVLDDAVEDEHIDRNPARGKRMRVRVPKPARTFLEMDELVALVDAATDQESAFRPARSPRAPADGTAARVATRLAEGLRPAEIAAELGLAKSTVSYHVRRLEITPVGDYVGRRAVIEILGRSGVRASELCDIRLRDIRLHDPEGARFRIPDSKTEAGIREVQMSPDLVEAFVEHVDRLRRAGLPTGPDSFAVPNKTGGRMTRQRVGQIVRDAAERATADFVGRGLPPLPHTTPHSLRRTYISIALLANNFDVKWVMSQVGHADSKMTLDVYAQLEQRVERSHGTAFDSLVRTARDQLHARRPSASEGVHWATNGPRDVEIDLSQLAGPADVPEEPADLQDIPPMARPGLEPGTPRFSVVCSTN